MGDIELISSLLGGVYDAALDPTLWQGVLQQTAAFVGGISATLYSKDATRKSGEIFYGDGAIDRHYVRLLLRQICEA